MKAAPKFGNAPSVLHDLKRIGHRLSQPFRTVVSDVFGRLAAFRGSSGRLLSVGGNLRPLVAGRVMAADPIPEEHNMATIITKDDAQIYYKDWQPWLNTTGHTAHFVAE